MKSSDSSNRENGQGQIRQGQGQKSAQHPESVRNINRTESYAIGSVVKLTGLSAHVIRVWERRYKAVVAHRLPSGRRIYDQSQVDKLLLLKKCTELGMSISTAAGLDDVELAEAIVELSQQPQFNGSGTSEEVSQYTFAMLGSAGLSKGLMQLPQLDMAFQRLVSNWTQVHMLPELQQPGPDILVLEVPSLGSSSVASVLELLKRCSPKLTVLIYRFANTLSLTALRNHGVRLAKSPLDEGSLANIILEFFGRVQAPIKIDRLQPKAAYPSHLFSADQLEKVANLPTKVDCECPHHLVDLLEGLKAFEQYSGDCVNKNDQDAALHAKIQRKTADARYQLEQLLEEVLEVEGIVI